MHSFGFTNSYIDDLNENFYSRHDVSALRHQTLLSWNPQVAKSIGISATKEELELFLNKISSGTSFCSDTVALCYSGHQFGQYVPRLGDGRALLLGQTCSNNNTFDWQLKGSGVTKFSRGGDGRAVLRSTIREYLGSQALMGLNIPTTMALAIWGSEEPVYREKKEYGAMLLRIAKTHIRFGTFEYFYYTNQHDCLKLLADFVIDKYYPSLQKQPFPYLRLLAKVVDNTALLIAKWQGVGFCHGVMNTDNMSILGETLDYGPFSFMDTYTANYVCNHSDVGGRYAFNKQPEIGLFNLSCLAQALLPLIHDDFNCAVDLAKQELESFNVRFEQYYLDEKRKKLGFSRKEAEDGFLYDRLLSLLELHKIDFTIFFRYLSRDNIQAKSAKKLFDSPDFDEWFLNYRMRCAKENNSKLQQKKVMESINPAYTLRNYMAHNAIESMEKGDFKELERIREMLANPFLDKQEYNSYSSLPPKWSTELKLSCSS